MNEWSCSVLEESFLYSLITSSRQSDSWRQSRKEDILRLEQFVATEQKKCPLSNAKQFEEHPRGSEEHFLEKDSGISLVMWDDNGVVTITSTHGVHPVKQV